MSRRTRVQIRALIQEAVILKEKFMRAGMYKTYHAMDEVTKKMGWELAEIIEKEAKEKEKKK